MSGKGSIVGQVADLSRRSPRAMFPHEPEKIEPVVDVHLDQAEALDAGQRQSLGAWHHLRAWLALEIERDRRVDYLPESELHVLHFTPGYFQDCAQLIVDLGLLIRIGPTWSATRIGPAWDAPFDRDVQRADLIAQIKGIALASMQYVNGEPVEKVIARDGARQAATSAGGTGRAAKLAKKLGVRNRKIVKHARDLLATGTEKHELAGKLVTWFRLKFPPRTLSSKTIREILKKANVC